MLCPRQEGGESSAQLPPRHSHDAARAHATGSSGVRGLDATAASALGAAERRLGRRSGRDPPRDTVHAQQGFRACLGILRLGERYGRDRLEGACQRALEIGGVSYGSVRSILVAGLDRPPETAEQPGPRSVVHENVRGADYYTGGEERQPC